MPSALTKLLIKINSRKIRNYLIIISIYSFIFSDFVVNPNIFQLMDELPPFYHLEQVMLYLELPYVFYNFGGPNTISIYYIIKGILSVIFGPGIVQRIIYIMPFYISSILFLNFVDYIFKLEKIRLSYTTDLVEIILSLVYSMSPFILDNFLNGEEGFMFMESFIPFYLLLLFKTIFEKITKNDILLSILISTFLISVSFEFSSFIFAIMIPFIVYQLLFEYKKLWEILKIISTLIVSIILNIQNLFIIVNTFIIKGAFFSDQSYGYKIYLYVFKTNFGISTFHFILFSLFITSILFLFISRKGLVKISAIVLAYMTILVYIYSQVLNGDSSLELSIAKSYILAVLIHYIYFVGIITPLSFTIFAIFVLILIKAGKRKLLYLSLVFIILSEFGIFIHTSLWPAYSDEEFFNFSYKDIFYYHEIKYPFISVSNFLIKQDLSYGYSLYSTMIPMTPYPCNFLPNYFMPIISPGFTAYFPSKIYAEEANCLLHENITEFGYLLAFSGIKYIVVMNYIYNTTWPHAYGSPTVSNWGNNYFITGSPNFVNITLSRSKEFLLVYNSINVSIYNNLLSRYPLDLVPFNSSNLSNLNISQIIHIVNFTNDQKINIVQNYNFINININEIKGRAYYLILDFKYDPNWILVYGNKQIKGFEGPFGLQAFNISYVNITHFILKYEGEATYRTLNYLSISLYVIISILAIVIRIKGRRT